MIIIHYERSQGCLCSLKCLSSVKYSVMIERPWVLSLVKQNLERVMLHFKPDLKPQTPQATVCCCVGAAALVPFRLGRPGPPARGFKLKNQLYLICMCYKCVAEPSCVCFIDFTFLEQGNICHILCRHYVGILNVCGVDTTHSTHKCLWC